MWWAAAAKVYGGGGFAVTEARNLPLRLPLPLCVLGSIGGEWRLRRSNWPFLTNLMLHVHFTVETLDELEKERRKNRMRKKW